MDSLIERAEPRTRRLMQGFVRRQESAGRNTDAAFGLACHAALPVALTPHFLHILRINFFLDPPHALPWESETALLLSPLCRELEDGLFEIEAEARGLLLEHLASHYGQERLREIAALLWRYSERSGVWLERESLKQGQRVSALNFLEPHKAQQWLEQARQRTEQGAAVDDAWLIAMHAELKRTEARIAAANFREVLQRSAATAERLIHALEQDEKSLREFKISKHQAAAFFTNIRNRLNALEAEYVNYATTHSALRSYMPGGSADVVLLETVDLRFKELRRRLELVREMRNQLEVEWQKEPQPKIKLKRLFVSHHPSDQQWSDALKKHLLPWTQSGYLHISDTGELNIENEDSPTALPMNVLEQITETIEQSDVVCAMVSAKYLASDYLMNFEFPNLEKKGRLPWVAIDHANYRSSPFYKTSNDKYQMIYLAGERPLISLSDKEIESAWQRISTVLVDLLEIQTDALTSTQEDTTTTVQETRNGHKIYHDALSGQIVVEDRDRGNRVLIETKTNAVILEFTGHLDLRTSGFLTLHGAHDVSLQSGGQVNIEGRAGVDIKTPNLLNLKGTAAANLTSAETLTIEGSLVKIN